MSGSTKTTNTGIRDRTTHRQPMARRILLTACLGVVGAASSATLAQAHYVHVPPVPAGLEAPEGNRAYLRYQAYGTQNYICLVAGQPWTFIGPQAALFNHGARQVLTHFLSTNPVESGVARATWLHSDDSTAVWAQAIASSNDPNFVLPGAIPWLLLRVVGAQDGPTGGRRISRTTFIQRVNTVGGTAPAGVCPAVGTRAFVPYETEYIFYKAE
jgi:hypothetical protein